MVEVHSKIKYIEERKIILVTGAAGFIGYHLSSKLLSKDYKVIGFDNLNDYYDVSLKEARLTNLKKNTNFEFVKGDLSNYNDLAGLFKENKIKIVINLAAQAGVRYSIENPQAYIQSNIVGFLNVLECCRNYPLDHLIYASSSSVYGINNKIPFSTEDKVDTPVSLYAATKKSNELMAYSYCKLYNIKATGLRFFTVYGPMGRPDMAYFSFANKIMNGKPIKVFNNGDMYRDFTYIDDVVEGVIRMIETPPKEDANKVCHKVYNIGNNAPEKLMDFIDILEKSLEIKATKEFYPMQMGDVYKTYADISELEKDFGFRPNTPLKQGLEQFVIWFKEYYKYN